MNKNYRSIWNEALGAWVAVSEIETAKGKPAGCRVKAAGGIRILSLVLRTIPLSLGFYAVSANVHAANITCTSSSTITSGSLVCGTGASANTNQSVAIGSDAQASGNQALAVGANTRASGVSSIAIGGDDLDRAATSNNTVITQYNTAHNNAQANNTPQALKYNQLTGDDLVNFAQPGEGVGKRYHPTTARVAAVAVGVSSNAADLATAFGTRADASGTASLALGVGSKADKENAVAIGAGSTTVGSATLVRNVTINGVTFTFNGGNNLKAGDQISFGSAGYERQLKNVAPGMVSAASTDAINGSQLYSVAEELTNIRKQTRYFSVNDAGTQRANYNNDGATHEGAMAVGTAATATSAYAVAVGNSAAASGKYGMALGANAAASVKDTIAVGQNARANADSAVAIGKNAQGAGAYAVSVGLDSGATQDSAVAVGSGAKATAGSATAVGNDAKAGGQNAVSLGKNNNVTAANAAAIGSNNTVSGTGTYVLGANNVSTAANTPLNLSNATIIGSSNKVNANANVHLQGNANTVTRTHAVVMGSSNTVAGAGTANEEPAIAIGTSNIIGDTGHNAITIGKQNNAAGTGSVAIGVASKTTHNSGVALGNTAQSINENGLAIGSYAVAGNYATAVGSRARAKQAHGLALGTTSFAGDRATAVGRYSAAHADSGVALGSDALVVSGAHGGLALGSGAVVSGQYSGAIGSSLQNNATAQAADRAINTRSVVGGANSYAIGNKNLIGNTSSDSFILGNNVKIGASNATLTTTNIAPARDTTPDRTDSITFGGVKAISGAVALGSNTKVEVSDGVALGKDSRASVSAGITGADPLEAAADKTGYAWTSTKAAVSVGNYENGNQQSRQITGVAAGQEDADAVNVAQLKAAGFKFTTLKNSGGTAENSRVAKVKNGDAIAFDAGKNMKLSQSLSPTNGETITFALEDDLKVSSITFPVDKTANPNAEDITLDNTQLSVNGTPYSNVGVAINALDTAVKAAKTKYYSVNDGGAEQDNHDNAGAEGEGALAAGVAAKAGKNYDNAVGYNAKTNTKAAFASSQGAMAFGSNTSADGNNAVAIGTSSVSEGDSAIAVGGQAEGTGATNIGYQANATGDAALSAGYYAKATAANATALGTQAKASKTGALAAGSGANAGGDNAVALGMSAAASQTGALAAGYNANAGAEQALALGSESRTESLRGIAIGAAAKALGSGKENNIAIGYGAQTESNDSIVIGSSATAVAEAENAVVLGKGARAGDAANSKGGNNSVAIGKGATVTANGSIALGEDAKATAAAGIPEAGLITAVGYKTEAGGMGSVALGASAATTSNAQYSTALGYNARTGKTDNSGQAERGGRYATAVGSNSRAQADNSAAFGASAVAENTGSVAIGNSSRAAIDNAVALGAGSVANVAGGAEGVDPLGAVTDKNNTTWTSRSLYGAVSVGNGTTVTRQITSVAAGTNDTDAVNVAQLKAAGFNLATSASDGQAVDNTAAPADKKVQNGETVTVDAGKNIKLTQNGNTISVATKDEVVFDKVTAGNGGNQVVLGNDGVQVGGNTYIDNNGLNANDKTIANVAPGSIAANSKQAVNGGQIFGIADSVAKALGGGSAVNADGLVSRPAYTVTDPATGNTTTANNVGDAITNLSNAANKPLTFAGDSGSSFERKLGTTANIKGGLTDAAKLSDNNIGVVSDGSDTLTVKLAKEISIDKVTAGNSVLDNGGLTITPASGSPVSLTAGGLDNGGNKIANVAEGTADTDAANVAQLKKAAAAAANKVKAGENITVAEEQNPDGSTTYTVATAKDVNFDSVTSGDTVLNKDGVKVGNDVALTSDGLTAGGLKVGSNGKITGLEKGEVSQNSKEAVNGGQLYAQGEGVKNIIGGTTAYDPDTGAFTNADIGGTGKGSIHDAIAAVKGTADQGWNLSANGKNSSNVKPGETVDLNNSDGNIVISKTDDSDNVTFDLAKAVTVDSLTAGDTTVNNAGVKVGDDVALTSDGLKAGDVAVNKDGINAGNKAVTNVAAGKAGTDAVNVSQLSPIAAALGTTVDANGTVAAPVFTVTKADGSQYAGANTIQGALDNIGTEIQKPLTFAGDSGSSFERKLGTTANIKGGLTDAAKLSDNNIGVVSDGSDTLTVKLAKEISIDKVTAGNSVLDNGGLTITPASGSPVSLTAGGLDNGGNKIANVAEGTADTDAANVAQLKKAAAAAANKVKAGENITVAEEQNPDGSTTYTVATAKDVNFDSVTSGDTVLNKDGVKVGNDVALTSDGLTAGGLKVGSNGKITGLEKGEVSQNSKEAVNGGQLYAQGEGVKNIIGGTTAYDPDTGAFTNADIGGTGKGSIHDAIAAVNQAAVKAKTTVSAGDNIVVEQSQNADGSANYTVATAKEVNFDQVTAGSGESQVVLGNDGVKVGGNTYIDKDGLNANNKAVTNVAAGRIAEDSKEAVNGGQLYNTVTSVAGVLGGDAKVAPDGSVGMSNIGGTGKGSIHDAIAAVNEAAVKAKTTVSAGDNIVVEQSSNADGSTNYKVATAKDLTVETVKAGGTTVNGNGLSIAGGPSVTVDGVDAGGKKITNVADGEISAASTDAINGSQLYYTNEAINNVANYTVNMGNQLNRRIDDVENRSNAGTATAMAVAGLPQAYLPGKSMVAVAGGTYRGESGYAVGYSSISDNGNWVIKGSATGNSRGHYGATAGVGYQW
ncbi:YadA-like family protein [Neisseria sp. 19428wB4_WF04]|uniref:YadA-like family protein n=1 Tax=Neisseria sp. 19428wB4_WF04 TaxID=2782469 RepID=UPI00142F7E79|nr:YadA-like family protein [Neisseria sp. 19428wB4_WF04]MBF0804587.1 YadA-like family protein [Neisseria sp. 19428wB4_WF04]